MLRTNFTGKWIQKRNQNEIIIKPEYILVTNILPEIWSGDDLLTFPKRLNAVSSSYNILSS